MAGICLRGGVIITKLRKLVKYIYKLYVGIGIFALLLIAGCVIFSVVMRYCFNISFQFLEEFITTVFAFTTFWGIGICFVENEHVSINSLYDKFPKTFKVVATVFNYLVTILVTMVMTKYGWQYAMKFGSKISQGMRIPMFWMYGIIPLGCGISLICIIVKFGCYIASLTKKE